MKYQIAGNYFNGSFNIPENQDEIFRKSCPGNTNQKLWEFHTSYEHIDRVIESAEAGHKIWKKTPISERINYLRAYQNQLKNHLNEIAISIALETGKPLWESKTEAQALITKVDITIDHSLGRIEEKKYPEIAPNSDGRLFFKPIGPCLIIGPFNFPCHLANGQITSALIAGNSIIFKPSEKTMASSEWLIRCLHQAGFPTGVVNLIQGGGEIASRLVKEKAIKGIFFTGSYDVGLKIVSNTSHQISKLVALELGGKNTSLVFEDAPLEHALTELVQACFLSSGQRCTSTSIIGIHQSCLDEFIDKFHQITKRIIIDHPIDYDQEPFMGPLIDEKSQQTYLSLMSMAKRDGAEEIMRGKALDKKFPGYYVSPSIHLIQKPRKDSPFLQTEIFGPNCTIIPFKSDEEAYAIANISEYGLASSIFTLDQKRQEQALMEIESGQVNINRSTIGASSLLPFGGIKNSGNYRPAAISMIDSCAYPVASLRLKDLSSNISSIRGITTTP